MLTTVFFTSLSAIAFEILLTRVFSISQWNHLSFMVISLALFGLAASGTFLNIYQNRHPGWAEDFFAKGHVDRLTLLFVASTVLSFLFVNHLPLDYFKLPIQPIQTLYLLAAYISLALPFFFMGMITSIAYITMPQKTGYIYFMNMCGSAIGAIIPMVFLSRLEEGRLIVLVAIVPLLAYILSIQSLQSDMRFHSSKHFKTYAKISVSIIIFLSLAIFALTRHHPILQVRPSDYKALSQMLLLPDTAITETSASIRGRVNTVKSPFLRFFPGLSLNYNGVLPAQFSVFKDGDGQLICYEDHKKSLEFSKHTLAYAGYVLNKSPNRVLIIQNGGGTVLPCAITAKASHITIIEKHPRFAEIIQDHYDIQTINESARSFLSRSSVTYPIIHLENWGTSLPGTSSLSQDYMFTKQAFQTYFNHLSADGLLIISRRLLLPPSHMVRLCATVFEALNSLQVHTPQHHMVILRNWDTFTLIVSKRPLTDVTNIEIFAREKNFDMVWPQDQGSPWINHFNKFEKPFHFLAVRSLVNAYESTTQKIFFQHYVLDVSPQTDNRPFPDKFFKWSRAKLIHQMTGSRLYSLLMSGELIVGIVFLEAVLISAFLLALPLFIFGRHRERMPISRVVFFLFVGAGFILFEIFFINTYILIFDDPVLSFTVVLSGLLIFSSAGGIISQHLKPKVLKTSMGLLCCLLFVMIITMDALLDKMMMLPAPVCFFMSMVLMLPAGLLLGIPFPMGMRCLLAEPAHRAYMWAANGCASVLASIAAAQMAISSGLKTLLWGALVCYVGAWLSAKVNRQE